MGQAISIDPAEEQYQQFMIAWACAPIPIIKTSRKMSFSLHNSTRAHAGTLSESVGNSHGFYRVPRRCCWRGCFRLSGKHYARAERLECNAPIPTSVRDALEDVTGRGSYWGCEGMVKCPECEDEFVVTGLCQEPPSLDSGKLHSRCTSCPDFGDCVGDYHASHCERCGRHYFQGLSGFSCSCTGKTGSQSSWEDGDDESFIDEGEYFECRNDS